MMPTPDLESRLRELAADHAMAVFGIADTESLAMDVPDLFDHLPRAFPRAIVMGSRLQNAVLDGIVDRPTPLYFHLYRQANYALDRAAFQVADILQSAGHAALAVPASQTVDRDPMRGHVSHKVMGWAAGLGWIGRQTLLIHPEYGARLRYVSVMTDAPLTAGTPIDRDCGECRRCVRVCPAGAINDGAKTFNLDACYAKLTEFSKIPRVGQHICGVCVRACRGNGRIRPLEDDH